MSWISTRSPQESLEILGDIASVCSTLGGPVSQQLMQMVAAKDYHGIVEFQFDYSGGLRDDLIYARQIQALFSKLEFLPLGVDLETVAYRKFMEAEEKCRETNIRLRKRVPANAGVERVLFTAQCKIASILGNVPSPESFDFSFGPGATTNVEAALACPRAKLGAELMCSTNLLPYVGVFLAECPLLVRHHATGEDETSFKVNVTASYGKLQFVPKNAKTHRSIVVEPILNSLFQSGVGNVIRDRLADWGVNLYDQGCNQRLAMRGSMDDSLSTIDLTSASDMISTAVVEQLLPQHWYQLLDVLRTPVVTYQGTPLVLQKFCSMGNGFTFPLESLIFYSIASACCTVLDLPQTKICNSKGQHHAVPIDVSVYGDDIIVPVGAYDLLKEVLDYVGFELNTSKSYKSGAFRESCGADYLSGFDIRPFYQKTLVSDRTLYTAHNWFLRHGEPALARAVLEHIGSSDLLYGPDGFGDGHLIGSYNLRIPRKLQRAGWCGGYFDTYALRPRHFKKPLPGDALLPAYSVYTRSGEQSKTDPDVIRGSRGYARMSIYTLQTGVFN